MRRVPLSHLEQSEGFTSPRRSFLDALGQDGLSVIAEVKKASPSKGSIREDIEPGPVARAYEEAGAAAVSVLTEPHYFSGSLEFLGAAREATSAPLLRKDFIVDPYQVIEARAAGADAILLIASVLDRDQLAELLVAASELTLDCLVETYWERDLDRIDFDQVQILGVNNRNLEDFTVDLGRCRSMFERIPPGVLRVAESGIGSAGDLVRIRDAGADAALVGESLMREPDPGAALGILLSGYRQLRRSES
jgi:indole-3-glycerol phosphate synthase